MQEIKGSLLGQGSNKSNKVDQHEQQLRIIILSKLMWFLLGTATLVLTSIHFLSLSRPIFFFSFVSP